MLVVISDVHVGAGVLDDCDAELEQRLGAFFDQLAARGAPVELVINGDFLDFAQAPPWQGAELESSTVRGVSLCFTEAQSLEKFAAIAEAHGPLFDGLARFLKGHAGNWLTILPGNHDADFFWPSVREKFADAVANRFPDAPARLRFHLEAVYRPASSPGTWIEHGHQYDPVNSFFLGDEPRWSEAAPPILEDKNGTRRLIECVGTRFMVRFLNRLDAEYPFVDNVKPFSRFLRLFAVSALKPGYGPISVTVSMWALLRYLSRTLAGSPSDLLSIPGADKLDAPGMLAKWAESLGEDERAAFVTSLRAAGFDAVQGNFSLWIKGKENQGALIEFVAMNLELLQHGQPHEAMLSIGGGGDGMLSLGNEYRIDETRRLADAARGIIERGEAKRVVMGHTHEPVRPTTDLSYCNIGSWTRYFQYAKSDKLQAWNVLRRETQAQFPFQLNFAEVSGDALAFRSFAEQAKPADNEPAL